MTRRYRLAVHPARDCCGGTRAATRVGDVDIYALKGEDARYVGVDAAGVVTTSDTVEPAWVAYQAARWDPGDETGAGVDTCAEQVRDLLEQVRS